MKHIKQIASAVLACALTLALAGCHTTTPATVMQVDGMDIPAGLYLVFQLQAYTSATSELADSTADVFKAQIEDKDGATWIHDETLRLARRYAYIEREFEAQGLSFTDEELANMQALAASGYASGETVYAKNGIGMQSYELFYMSESKYEKLFEAFSADYAEGVSDTEAKAYMDKVYAHVAQLRLPTADENNESLSDENVEIVKGYADELLAELNAGGNIEELAPDYLEKVFALSDREYTEDALSSYYYAYFISAESSIYDEELTQRMLDAKVGYAELADTEAPAVYQKIANYTDDEDFVTYRDRIVQSMAYEAMEEQVESQSNAYTVTEDAAAVNTYSPRKIVTE